MSIRTLTVCPVCGRDLPAGTDAHVVPGGPYGFSGYLFVHPECCEPCQQEEMA